MFTPYGIWWALSILSQTLISTSTGVVSGIRTALCNARWTTWNFTLQLTCMLFQKSERCFLYRFKKAKVLMWTLVILVLFGNGVFPCFSTKLWCLCIPPGVSHAFPQSFPYILFPEISGKIAAKPGELSCRWGLGKASSHMTTIFPQQPFPPPAPWELLWA